MLPEDEPSLREFESRWRQQCERHGWSYPDSPHRLHLEVPPEPFIGNPEASVVLLLLNPGYSDEDFCAYNDPTLDEASRLNRQHGLQDSPYPFYYLDPRFQAYSGSEWWRRHLRRLIDDCGLESVARNVACIEHFPYHSQRYPGKVSVPSQYYGFHLVEQAIERDAVIVLVRGKGPWFASVLALESYSKCIELKNKQNVRLTRGNCPDGCYDRIVKAIR